MRTTKSATTKSATTRGELFIDTMTLAIAYTADRTIGDMFEIRKTNAPIREKMRSSHNNNIFVEYYKPKSLSVELFTKMVHDDLKRYGFTNVEIGFAHSHRKRNGLTRAFLEQIFDKVSYLDTVLPTPSRKGAHRE